jgi:hypothetical protein
VAERIRGAQQAKKHPPLGLLATGASAFAKQLRRSGTPESGGEMQRIANNLNRG